MRIISPPATAPHPLPLPNAAQSAASGEGRTAPHPLPLSTSGEGRTTTAGDDARLKTACDDFEAVLLAQIIRTAQPSAKDGVFGSSDADEVFQSQFTDALASTMAKRGALGISQMVYRELSGGRIQVSGAAETMGTARTGAFVLGSHR